jgi:CheY-like chemotaxis protein
LIELMGGEIGVASTQGQGSTFWFRLRLERLGEALKLEPAATLPQTLRAAASGRALDLLLAEDNHVNQVFAVALLEKAGHRVTVVENGRQAVEAVAGTPFDAVLMDIQMPELDGIEATRRIRALPPPASGVRIIALTANAMAGAEETYRAAGMDDFVSKPINPALLFQKLGQVAPAAAAKPDTAAVLARDKLESLADVLPPARMKSLLELYLLDAEKYLAQLRQAAELDEIGRNAHVLAGTGGNIGAEKMSRLAHRLQQACRAGDAGLAASLVIAVDEAAAESSQAIREWIAALPLQASA